MSLVLSVRLSNGDRKKLEALAEDLDIGPSVLARMLIRSSLADLEALTATRDAGRLPLSLLSQLLVPAARAKRLAEEDLESSLKAVRKKLWQERYADRR